MNNDVGIVLLARTGSKRLPRKALLPIKGRPAIGFLIDRLKRSKYPLVVAIPDLEEDDELAKVIEDQGTDLYRGASDNPLKRMSLVAEEYGFKHIVRVTHDDLIVDVQILHLMANFHLKRANDYTYTALIPEGCGCEVIDVDAIKKALGSCQDSSEYIFEGISNYFRNNDYKWNQYIPNYVYQYPYRLTMDTYEDYVLLKILSEQLPDRLNKSVSLDFIHHLKNYPSLRLINKVPLVTIYIPNYNYSKYLKEAIDSAINQSYEDIEIIVIDDCSTDDSFQVLKEYIYPDSPIRIIFNESNLGLPATCNKAISYARGKYICRIDADDRLETNAIARLLAEFENNPELSAVFSSYVDIDKKGIAMGECLAPFDHDENEHHPTGCLIQKRCWEDLKYNDLLIGYESYEFLKRFIKHYKVGYVKTPLWFKRAHGDNMSLPSENRMKLKKEIEGKS